MGVAADGSPQGELHGFCVCRKELVSIAFDPYLETADADVSNNEYPRTIQKSRFKLFKKDEEPNHMLRDKES